MPQDNIQYPWENPTGLQVRPPYRPPLLNNGMGSPNNSLTNHYRLFGSGVEQNAEDYSDIMAHYRRLLESNPSNQPQRFQQQSFSPVNTPSPYTYRPLGQPSEIAAPREISPSLVNYTGPSYHPSDITVTGRSYIPTIDTLTALRNFRDLSDTGGYSGNDIESLRARGLSPIRAIYANAQRNMDRNRALRGGIGGNYNAVSAKMAREMADTIGEQTHKVNADIASRVAAGKASGTAGYSNLAAAIEAARNAVESENMAAKNRVAEINASRRDAYNTENSSRRFDTERYNAEAINRANLENIANRISVDRYNTEGVNEANRLNSAGINETNRLNAESRNRANEMNWAQANDVNRFNAQGVNDTNRFNDQMRRGNLDDRMRVIDAMRNLYGTTPALANMFGNQALSFSDLYHRIGQQNSQNANQLTSMVR